MNDHRIGAEPEMGAARKRTGRGSLRDVPIKKDNPYPPDWITPGAWVEHDLSGRGQVISIFLFKRMWMIGLDFDRSGRAMMGTIGAVQHLRPTQPPLGVADRLWTHLRRLARRALGSN
jgi:hypothetical protein